MKSPLLGHFLAIFTIIVWGSTFSATKFLLESFSSYDILVFRFLLAYICLFILYPKFLKPISIQEEVLFALCGLSGVCLYFLLENIALKYTLASNAGLLVSINPIYTAILGLILFKKPLKKTFFMGFLFVLVGIVLIVFEKNPIQINLLGDFLCILAGLSWAFYTIFLEKLFIIKKDTNTLLVIKKIFFYGTIFSSFTLFFDDSYPSIESFFMGKNLFNLLFLGIGASALCYLSWGMSLKILGTLKVITYQYAIPVVSVIVASITLGEPITLSIIAGSILLLFGIFLSQKL